MRGEEKTALQLYSCLSDLYTEGRASFSHAYVYVGTSGEICRALVQKGLRVSAPNKMWEPSKCGSLGNCAGCTRTKLTLCP